MSKAMAARRSFASAPLRLDFAGGWTDVPPFSAREGGRVVNAAIGLYAHVEVDPGGDGLVLSSHDLGEELRLPSLDAVPPEGKLALLQAALRMFPVFPCTITSRSEAPAGSGLGSSGAIDVALVSALSRARGEALHRPEIAQAAWRLEVVEAGIPGGKQDQWAAALGGFRDLTFSDPRVESAAIRLEPAFQEHLQRHTILCYTGTSRISGRMISRVMQGYETGNSQIVAAFRGLKETAERMVEALARSNVTEVGQLLSRNWGLQCQLDGGMRTDEMARVEQAVTAAGVLGGKAAGAGAGGCMFFLARSDPAAVAAAAREAGARLLPVSWVPEGVRSW